MMERQIDRIQRAEEAVRELLKVAAQIREKIDSAETKDPGQLKELSEAAEGFEKEAERIRDALREWREDIH
jgi:erythromycin esterase-like protein